MANYNGGSVASLPVRADGGLDPAVTVDQHHGSSVHPTRQKGPFGHCIEPDPTNQFALSADLGIDKILIYKLDPVRGTLRRTSRLSRKPPRGLAPAI